MNRIRTLLAALGLAVLALITPAAAQAQPPDGVEPLAFGDCYSAGYFCVWDNWDAAKEQPGGRYAQFRLGSPNLVAPVGGYVFNDKISAVWNRTSRTWCLYPHSDYQGVPLKVTAGWRGSLSPRGFSDAASSLRPC
jgi:hypothetical protein